MITEFITSKNNPTVKWAATLKDKKGRDASRAFIAEGEKLSFEALNFGLAATHIFVSEEKKDYIIPKLSQFSENKLYADTKILILSEQAFSKISTENAPQGIITVIKYLDFFNKLDIIYKEEFLKNEEETIVFLDSVRDPSNLGAIIRSALAFGVKHIILSSDCTDAYNPKCIRASMGGVFKTKLSYVKDAKGTICEMRKASRRVLSAELNSNAMPLEAARLCRKDVIVIGNEGHGVSCEVSASCDNSIYIPISTATESLNASVAAAIFMWEQSKN